MKGILVALLLTGCATSSTIARGPNGQPMHTINGIGATAAYKDAAAKCPNGYTILHSREQGLFFVLDVECKG